MSWHRRLRIIIFELGYPYFSFWTYKTDPGGWALCVMGVTLVRFGTSYAPKRIPALRYSFHWTWRGWVLCNARHFGRVSRL